MNRKNEADCCYGVSENNEGGNPEKVRKRIFPWLGLGILTAVLCCILWTESGISRKEFLTGSFSVLLPGEAAQTVRLWSADGENCYLFLPSYVSPENVSICVGNRCKLFLDGCAVEDGDAVPQAGRTCTMTCRRGAAERSGTLTVMRSANVATVFIDSDWDPSGVLYNGENGKSVTESIDVRFMLVDENGDHWKTSSSEAVLKARGNTTSWPAKKPFLLKTDAETDVFGMGRARNWVLLANAYDSSNLRTKLVYDVSRGTGLIFTPECRFADLYLNGNYNGLYLLTEKAEFGSARLNPPEGSYLLDLDVNSTEGQKFYTESGQKVFVAEPKKATAEQSTAIAERFEAAESALLGKTQENSAFPDAYFDIRTWAAKYLTDEIFLNLDAAKNSCYFYTVSGEDNRTFYAGPLWDYDNCWGNPRGSGVYSSNPETFYAKGLHVPGGRYTNLYAELYADQTFAETVAELYRKDYLPALEKLMESGIDTEAELISAAAGCNAVRWNGELEAYAESFPEAVATMKEYLGKRLSFLNSAWVDGKEYCTVHAGTWYYSVEKGQTLEPVAKKIGLADGKTRRDSLTGETVSANDPVMHDLHLVSAKNDSADRNLWQIFRQELKESGVMRAVVLSCLVLLAAFGAVLLQNRRGKNGR